MRLHPGSLSTAPSQSICFFCLYRPVQKFASNGILRQPLRMVTQSARPRQHTSQNTNDASPDRNAFPTFRKHGGALPPHQKDFFGKESRDQPRNNELKLSSRYSQPRERTDGQGQSPSHNAPANSFRRSSPYTVKPRDQQQDQFWQPLRPDRNLPVYDPTPAGSGDAVRPGSNLDRDRPIREFSGRNEDAQRRRSRPDKDRKSNRRAQKFDFGTPDPEQAQLDLKAAERRAKKDMKKKLQKEKEEAARAQLAKQIDLPSFIGVANLATMLKIRQEPFLDKLGELGFTDINSDSFVSYEDASLIAMEYGFYPRVDQSDLEDLKPRPPASDKSLLPQRPPVVTIMGHVDHGKTTLLDYLRKSSVAAQEHGGITQHIGAFSVPMASGKTITFLDTPGHAAFLSMRQRGANVTDIVILVVAADDSVKPQTVEAIKHAKNAQVPIIVAINKVDKEEADIEGVKQDLLRHDITVEDFSGDVQAYPVSGKTGQGLDDLVEAIDTQAEILDMRAETDGAVEGWVLETATTKAGRMATILVRRGTLKPGDVVVAGTAWAKVRTLKNEAGVLVSEATPGTPVEVDGWRNQPEAGDEVLQAASEQKANSVVNFRQTRLDQSQAAKDMEEIMEYRKVESERREREKAEKEKEQQARRTGVKEEADLQAEITQDDGVVRTIPKPKDPEIQALYFIIKADVSGSAEAIEESITSLPVSNQPVELHILRAAVGQVSEFDVDHAATVTAGQSFIVSFNQPMNPQIATDAEKRGVNILDETIIYKVLDSIRSSIESKLPPIVTKRVVGEAEAAQVFEINTSGRKYVKVAGCRVTNGIVGKNKNVRVFRGGNASINSDSNLVYEGTISTLKSHKTDVQEMRKGTECGMSFEKWQDFKAGDIIQCYEARSEPRRLL